MWVSVWRLQTLDSIPEICFYSWLHQTLLNLVCQGAIWMLLEEKKHTYLTFEHGLCGLSPVIKILQKRKRLLTICMYSKHRLFGQGSSHSTCPLTWWNMFFFLSVCNHNVRDAELKIKTTLFSFVFIDYGWLLPFDIYVSYTFWSIKKTDQTMDMFNKMQGNNHE